MHWTGNHSSIKLPKTFYLVAGRGHLGGKVHQAEVKHQQGGRPQGPIPGCEEMKKQIEHLKRKQKLPPGMTEERIKAIIDHYENQTEDEAVAEDEAAFAKEETAMVEVPRTLVDKVRELILSATTKRQRAKVA